MDRGTLLRLIDRFAGRRVGVVGDLMADLYTYGKPTRLSREAPVMIIEYENQALVPGGAANNVANLLALGAEVQAVGLVGDDGHGRELLAELARRGAALDGVCIARERRTICKERIMAGDLHTTKQQVVRVDRSPGGPVRPAEEQALLAALEAAEGKVDVWLVADYGYQTVTPRICDWLRARPRQRVVVDSRHELSRFVGATAATPNETEVAEVLGARLGDEDRLEALSRRLLAELRLEALLVTRGNRGMWLLLPGRDTERIPIVGSSDIVDVSGAGDTVTSTVALALAAGADWSAAAQLANHAASVVVMKRGTAVCTSAELRAAVEP